MRAESIVALSICISVLLIGTMGIEWSLTPLDALHTTLQYLAFAVPVPMMVSFFLLLFYLSVLIIPYRIVIKRLGRRKRGANCSDKQQPGSTRFLSWDILAVATQLFIVFVPSAMLLGEMNVALHSMPSDRLFWGADAALFGAQPFVLLPTLLSQTIATYIFWYAYIGLTYVTVCLLVFLFFISRKDLFRWALVSFMLSLYLAWPLYVSFPCHDPGNYFVRNIQGSTFSPEISAVLASYGPNPATVHFVEYIQGAETTIVADTGQVTVPISCFPSMHAVWGLMCVVLLGALHRRFLPYMFAWYVVMLLGGLYFAQHYVIDYIVAIPFAAGALLFGRWLVVRDGADLTYQEDRLSEFFIDTKKKVTELYKSI